jgi:tryptophan synthase alpha chain
MTSRIPSIFRENAKKNKKTFISYLVCGDPSKNDTLTAMKIMADSGVDVIELGIPFTDPIADGPVIQKSIDRALKNNVSLKDVISVVEKFRKTNKKTAVVLMGYMNPVHKMGVEKFTKSINRNDIDGVLIVDSPPEESIDLNSSLKKYNKSHIYLASPTTTDQRMRSITQMSSGYVYYVTVKGITGSKLSDISTIKKNVAKIKKYSKNNIPVAVGFGIKDSKSAKQMSKFSDGIIIGSSIVELIHKHSNNKNVMKKNLTSYLSSISRAI